MTAILRKPDEQAELTAFREKAKELEETLADIQSERLTPIHMIKAIQADLAEINKLIKERWKGTTG